MTPIFYNLLPHFLNSRRKTPLSSLCNHHWFSMLGSASDSALKDRKESFLVISKSPIPSEQSPNPSEQTNYSPYEKFLSGQKTPSVQSDNSPEHGIKDIYEYPTNNIRQQYEVVYANPLQQATEIFTEDNPPQCYIM
ncbi:hypothetical protein VNO77_39219 [Canavalia gladiata]|uniref:Uncharacterized protein n=1 Tax=Canavalia gladiata TaxID=3824 RepID=A0AAN9KC97_CANGL